MKKEIHTHLFVCTNDKGPGKQSCGAKNAGELRTNLKSICREKNLSGVRINAAGCLGKCELGIAAVLYPEGQWFDSLKPQDTLVLLEAVEASAHQKEKS